MSLSEKFIIKRLQFELLDHKSHVPTRVTMDDTNLQKFSELQKYGRNTQ